MLMRQRLKNAVKELIRIASTRLPSDVYEALRRAYERESGIGKVVIDGILRNVDLAARLNAPICQDTGIPMFFVRVGEGFPIKGELYEILKEAVVEATQEIPLRPNIIDILEGRNTGDNTGPYVPIIHVELTSGDMLELTFVAKGGGSEQASLAFVLPPLQSWRGLVNHVVNHTIEAIGRVCSPIILGIGIGASADLAVYLAYKAALLRKVGSRNSNPRLAKIEELLLDALNSLGLGPQGLGGSRAVLDVHIECGGRHVATFAIALVYACWALRRATLVMKANGEYEIRL